MQLSEVEGELERLIAGYHRLLASVNKSAKTKADEIKSAKIKGEKTKTQNFFPLSSTVQLGEPIFSGTVRQHGSWVPANAASRSENWSSRTGGGLAASHQEGRMCRADRNGTARPPLPKTSCNKPKRLKSAAKAKRAAAISDVVSETLTRQASPATAGGRRVRRSTELGRSASAPRHVIVSAQPHVCKFGGRAGAFHCPACAGTASSLHVQFLRRQEVEAKSAFR
jgi:hypothetical protein